jgi:hypothetical protein
LTIQALARTRILLCLALAPALVACESRPGAGGRQPVATDAVASENAYRAPPELVSISPIGAGSMTIIGTAQARTRVRLAGPAGAAAVTRADDQGHWRIGIARSQRIRLFGLSMAERGRTIQSQGYLAIPPAGPAAQLRAGAGAVVFTPPGGALRLLAVDYDRQGGAVVSGSAVAGAMIETSIDGVARGEARADRAGHFSVALDKPLAAGVHRLSLFDGRVGVETQVSLEAPTRLNAPFEAAPVGPDWRIDWVTPGGGVQATLLLGSSGGAK